MYPTAIGSRGIEFGGRLTVAVCIMYIGSILPASAHSNIAKSNRAIEANGSDRVLSQDGPGQPWQDDSDFPDTTADIDEADDARLDLSCDNDDQDTPQFCIVDLDAITLRASEIIHTLRVPLRSFYCLHEHIRERAPLTMKQRI